MADVICLILPVNLDMTGLCLKLLTYLDMAGVFCLMLPIYLDMSGALCLMLPIYI